MKEGILCDALYMQESPERNAGGLRPQHHTSVPVPQHHMVSQIQWGKYPIHRPSLIPGPSAITSTLPRAPESHSQLIIYLEF